MTTYGWCAHCLKFSRAAIEANFISCSTCGKLLSEVKEREASRLRKKNYMPRFKRTRKAMKIRPNSPIESDEEFEERFRTLGL